MTGEPRGSRVVGCGAVRVVAGSRLHGGFHTLPGHGRGWGSIGFYIDGPRVVLEAWRCGEPRVEAPEGLGGLVEAGLRASGARGVCARLLEHPPRHVGLGSTTQVVLSAYAAGRALSRGRPPGRGEIIRAALELGRGRYSLAGTLLFTHGGIVVDAGSGRGADAAPLWAGPWPRGWTAVVVLPRLPPGPEEGEWEDRVLSRAPPAPARLQYRASRGLHIFLEGLAAGDVDRAVEGLTMIQGATGSYFSGLQGGVYRRDLARLADEAWRDGVFLAQSSWGPTLYALTTLERAWSDAKTLRMIARILGVEADVFVARPRDLPACVECLNTYNPGGR